MPSTVTIYHYPQCSKSRAALEALEEAGVEHVVREYRKDKPSKAEVLDLIDWTGGNPRALVREHEEAAVKLSEQDLEDTETVAAFIAKHPEVLQRPILVAGKRASIARTPEAVQAFLERL